MHPRAGVQREEPKEGIPASMLKQGRRSGQLNASGRNLTQGMGDFFYICRIKLYIAYVPCTQGGNSVTT